MAYRARPHLPAENQAWCDEILTRSWADNNRNLHDLDRILGILDDAKIPAISLKGPLLARRHYRPAFLRKRSRDIDVAVRDRDVERATAALREVGYAPLVELRESRLRTHHFELFQKGEPPVELHFRLTHGAFGIPVEEFFDRAVSCELPSGRTALVLGPADELMHLILHFAYGRSVGLFHLNEIRLVWEHSPASVRCTAVDRAIQHHFTSALAFTDVAFQAHWGRRLFGPEIELPGTWLQRWIDDSLYQDFQRCHAIPVARQSLPMRLRTRWLDFRLTDTPSDAFRLAAGLSRAALFQMRPWK